jgi:hypothetical protein
MFTHNRKHYEDLAAQYFVRNQTQCGIIIAARRPPFDLAHRLIGIMNPVTADEMDNQLVYL